MTDTQPNTDGPTQEASTIEAGESGLDSVRNHAASSTATPRSLRRLTGVSVTFRTHSTTRVGSLAPETPRETAERIHDNDRVTEAMVLSTCNRLEVYVSTRTPRAADRDTAIEAINAALDLPDGAEVYTGLEVPTHLARVTAGLESAMLGEDEIAGQVSDTLADAKEADLAAGILGRVGNTAVRAGRKCRTETQIAEGPTDYGSAVCRQIAAELDASPGRMLVIGAGEMARTAVNAALSRWDVRVDVVNRSPAEGLATTDGTWWTLSELESAVSEVDVIVSATDARETVFDREHANNCHAGTPVIDLATPPDVAEGARAADISVIDLETLGAVVDAAAANRQAAVSESQSVIADAIDRLVERERENRAEDVIRELHQDAKEIRIAELERAKQRLAAGDTEPEEVLEDLASALTGRLLGPATDELRTAARERDETALRAARRLFDLDGGQQ